MVSLPSLPVKFSPWSQESAYSHPNFLTFNLIDLDLRILEESRTLWMPRALRTRSPKGGIDQDGGAFGGNMSLV
jgi:hypothetical protein